MICIDIARRHPGKRGEWCHLWSSNGSVEALHGFAQKIGVNQCWFQNRRGRSFPHYDLNEANSHAALRGGAYVTSLKDWLRRVRGTKGGEK